MKLYYKKSNGARYIIKKPLEYDENGIISDDLIKEMYLLKRINDEYPEICPIFHGIVYQDNFLCLILEDCGTDIMTYFDNNCNAENFKDIFRQLLNHINCLNNMGIIHHDLHWKNVMVKNGKVKIIDLGISFFYEIFPLKENFPYWHDRAWIPFDGIPSKVDIDEIPIDENKISLENYSFDIYSVGVMMLQIIYKRDSSKFILTKDGKLAYRNKQKEYKLFQTDKIEKFSDKLENLIKHMIDSNTSMRYTAIDALNHPYFNENSQERQVEYRVESLNLNSSSNFINLFHSKYYISNVTNAQMIHNIYRKDIVRVINKIEDTYIEKVLKKLNDKNVSFNTIFNVIFALFQYYSNGKIKSFIDCYFYIYSSIYDFKMCDKINLDGSVILEEMKNKNINYYPVTVHFNYVLKRMMEEGVEYEIIFRNLMEKFVHFLFNVNYDFNIWNVISVIMHKRFYLEDYDLSNYDRITITLKC